VGLNSTRTGVLAVLLRMGAHVSEIVETEATRRARERARGRMGAQVSEIVATEEPEAMGTIEIKGERLRGTEIKGAEIPNVIDEIPILAVAAALAAGRTVISDARELRVKETDRLAAIAINLRAMGAHVAETEDGLTIDGGFPLQGARIDSFGDHRIAMAFAIAGLFAEGETVITNTDCVNTSYPTFYNTLDGLIRRPPTTQIPVITSLPVHD